MIAACPKCEARYRVDETRIGPEGARMKCAKCEALFRVRAPASAPAPAPIAAPVAPVEVEAPAAAAVPAVPSPQPSPEVTAPARSAPALDPPAPAPEHTGVVDRARLVLIADPSVDSGKRTVNALTSWGMHPILVHDGVEAMLTIQRMLPRVVILDAALPKMFGFQVCEIIKRNDSLRDTGVVLIGAIHNRDRYHRPPSELYGADVYLEHPDLPDGLRPILEQLGIELTGAETEASGVAEHLPAPDPAITAPSIHVPPAVEAPAAPAPAAAPPAASVPAAPPVAAAAAPADGLADERAKAERLARIVASDIVLYQPDKFSEAVKQGNVVEAMDAEIEEARALFRQRVDERVREERDFIVDELLRVAGERGMQ